MRKTIEILSTLFLWFIFIGGSILAARDLFFSDIESRKIVEHAILLTWAPIIAVILFVGMLIAIRRSQFELKKKNIPCAHAVQWTGAELLQAKNAKVVDLHFVNSGLTCNVVSRSEVATVLHNESQMVCITITSEVNESDAAVGILAQQRI